MSSGLSFVSSAVGAVGSLFGSSSSSSAATAQARQATREEQIAAERKERELRIQREQTDRAARVAAEQAEWEEGVSLEKTVFTQERIQEEADAVKASQIVGYAAAGVSTRIGSPVSVMARTAKTVQIEKEAIMRGHELMTEARMKEVAEIEMGGEEAYRWFTERIEAETAYEIEGRESEASMYRKQASDIKIGGWISAGSSLLGAASSLF